MYQPYVDDVYYAEEYKGSTLPKEKTEKSLKQASHHIDALTFNRIVGNFERLTEFQKDIIREVICRLADFEYENESFINSVISAYSINGVGVSIGDSWNVKIIDGVAISQDLYNLLSQTGLCFRGIGL